MIDTKFAGMWRSYLLQVGAATLYLIVALLIVDGFANLAVVSAIAASTFLVFCVPRSPMASPWNIGGGHTVAVLVTLAMSPIVHDAPWQVLNGGIAVDVLAAIAVGITMLVMAVTNTEHAPGAATALGLSLQPWSLEVAASILIMAAILVVFSAAGRGRLVNLL